MPNFFPFIQGTESTSASRIHGPDSTSPLLGRFRAVPPSTTSSAPRSIFSSRWESPDSRAGPGGTRTRTHADLLSAAGRNSVHIGYGALITAELDDEDDTGHRYSEDDDNSEGDDGAHKPYKVTRIWRKTARRTRRVVEDLWVAPKHNAVRRVVETWWRRWGLLIFTPAVLAVAWCAIPFPQYPLDDSEQDFATKPSDSTPGSPSHRVPGHGEARVQVNFWFFLFVYYGFYNLIALLWITKVFNLYSLNWWPSMLGFPITASIIAIIAIAGPIPAYLIPEANFLTVHNTAWTSWTFVNMSLPVAIALCILMTHERHLGLRHSLSETQRIFTSSWWTGEGGGSIRDSPKNRRGQRWGRRSATFDPDIATMQISSEQPSPQARPFIPRRRWLPASFVRWVITVHLLDMLTGWILGGNEGERVGSYPLSWIFKLYFMLTYQTYVRALYARLRSPQQFIWLQALSSAFLIVLTPLTMTETYHRALTMLGLTNQSYGSYQKICTRNVFIRFLAENVSMLTFLGSILVLHFGPNTDVYPYFAFDDPDEPYNFKLTLVASATTWACEIVAGIALRGLIHWIFGVNANIEGRMDLAVWPELLPTSVFVMLHVLQNMLFSIIRLHFR